MNILGYSIFSCLCLISTFTAVVSAQLNRSDVILDLYNEKLIFFDSFLSSAFTDRLASSSHNISIIKTTSILRYATVPFSSLQGEILSWCTQVKSMVDIPDVPQLYTHRLQGGIEFSSKVHTRLSEMKEYFQSIPTDNHTLDNTAKLVQPLAQNATPRSLDEYVNYAKNIITEALHEINATKNGDYNKNNTLVKCNSIFERRATKNKFDLPLLSSTNEPITPSLSEITPSSNTCRVYSTILKKEHSIYFALFALCYVEFVTMFLM